nr:NAD-dependent epimerase/dehydratase family protein [Pseudenhygromyxa sp. WMMC2535]
MRLLLTGSSGWLGRFLAPVAMAAGHEVVGLDVAPGRHTTQLGSVADRGLLERLFRDERPEAVIHCGALHKPDIARFDEQTFVAVNVLGGRATSTERPSWRRSRPAARSTRRAAWGSSSCGPARWRRSRPTPAP